MIQIRVTETQEKIRSIEITGHADSAPYGQDLVCASVSTIAFGLCNAIDLLNGKADVSIQDNRIYLSKAEPDTVTQTVLHTGLIQLQTLAETNPAFLSIQISEV